MDNEKPRSETTVLRDAALKGGRAKYVTEPIKPLSKTAVVSYPDSVAMRCVLEELRDNPGSIAPPVAAGAAAWALGRIRHLEDVLGCFMEISHAE